MAERRRKRVRGEGRYFAVHGKINILAVIIVVLFAALLLSIMLR